MKILFLTDNFPPEVNAPATRTYEHCAEWVKQGADVTVITCFPNFPQGKIYEGYKNKLYQKEIIDGIKVIRVWSYITSNDGFLKRTLDYISFAFMSFWASFFVKTDIIIATSPQFFVAMSGRLVSFFKRKPWIMEVRDLWPESIKAVGAVKNDKIIHFLEKIELHLYRNAVKIIVVTEAFKKNIVERGITADKIFVIKNGVKLDKFSPAPKNNALIEKHGLKDKFIMSYLGTHGLAHKLDFILDCAVDVSDPRIHFLFIGNGAEKEKLLQKQSILNLTNTTFLDSVSKVLIKDYIGISDIALVCLKKSNTFKTVIPSKIFENAAMLKPILLGVEGESKEIIEHYKAGLCFEPENKQDFLNQLYLLANDSLVYKNAQKGCEQLANDFKREELANKMYQIILN